MGTYPPSGDALRLWQFLNLNPDKAFSLSGTYSEVQLKENVILPMLTLAGRILPPFSADRCSEYPISHKNDRIHLEGMADLVYVRPPDELGELLRDPFLCVHGYKREKNPVEIFDAMAQLLGGMWILLKKNQDAGRRHPIYGLMVKGQTWRFAELHPDEKDDSCRAVFDADGFFIRSDTDRIFRALRHYFLLAGKILNASGMNERKSRKRHDGHVANIIRGQVRRKNQMKKFFNTAGPCFPEEHYMLPARERIGDIAGLIERKQHFVIHAARQTGKTTFLLELLQDINASGKYHAMYCTLESVQEIDEPEKGIPAIVRRIGAETEFDEALTGYGFAEDADYSNYSNILRISLSRFCKQLKKPLVILFDEADCLSDGTLISFLRQLRDGFVNRGRIPFVHSVGLIGMRNIRDYKALIRSERHSLGSASPFNIVSEVFTLRNFNQEEVALLLSQHDEATGQAFPPEVADRIWRDTRGQPWLVNAIAREIVDKMLEGDPSRKILPEHPEQAAQRIIARRDTHIDSLLERLKEARVRKVVEPVITGENKDYDLLDDDYQYVSDMGLLRESSGKLVPANPIYAEVIVRTLSFGSQRKMEAMNHPPKAPGLSAPGPLSRLITDSLI